MLTIWDWFDRNTPMMERYQMIKTAGFDGVMMWWSNEFGRDAFGTGDYRRSPSMARDAGLMVENIHLPVALANDLWEDNLNGQSIYESYHQSLNDCATFDIPTMVMHLPAEERPLTSLGLDRLKALTEKAEASQVNLALENLRNLNNLSHIFEQIDSNRVGFCYDSGHHYHYYPDKDFLDTFGHRLMALHLHDDNGSRGMHGLPMDGTIDWQEVMFKIALSGYEGPTAIEPMKWAYEALSTTDFLDIAYDKAKRLDLMRRRTKVHGVKERFDTKHKGGN